jgi:hypothetical protein
VGKLSQLTAFVEDYLDKATTKAAKKAAKNKSNPPPAPPAPPAAEQPPITPPPSPPPQEGEGNHTLEKEFGFPHGNKQMAIEKIQDVEKDLLLESEESPAFWDDQMTDLKKLMQIEISRTVTRKGVMDAFEQLEATIINEKEKAIAREKLSTTEADGEKAKQQLSTVKDVFGESGNTSISAILNMILKVINKMFRLVKLKREEWKTTVIMKDLKDVRDKVVEYYNKFNEINPSDKVMNGHADSYKLANTKMEDMKNEFEVLVKTSNLSQQIYGGGRMKFADEATPLIFKSKLI